MARHQKGPMDMLQQRDSREKANESINLDQSPISQATMDQL